MTNLQLSVILMSIWAAQFNRDKKTFIGFCTLFWLVVSTILFIVEVIGK